MNHYANTPCWWSYPPSISGLFMRCTRDILSTVALILFVRRVLSHMCYLLPSYISILLPLGCQSLFVLVEPNQYDMCMSMRIWFLLLQNGEDFIILLIVIFWLYNPGPNPWLLKSIYITWTQSIGHKYVYEDLTPVTSSWRGFYHSLDGLGSSIYIVHRPNPLDIKMSRDNLSHAMSWLLWSTYITMNTTRVVMIMLVIYFESQTKRHRCVWVVWP
jgi:hypothetical protein